MELPVFLESEGGLTQVGCLSVRATLQGLYELGRYQIAVPFSGARLYVDDALLEMDRQQAFWIWQPGFYSGEVTVELELADESRFWRYVADVAPAENKSGRDQFHEYLSAIVEYSPSLVLGSEPGKHGLAGQSDNARSIWLRYFRLKKYVSSYLDGLKLISERPVVRPESYREQVPLSMARRVDVATLRRLAGDPALLAAFAGVGDEPLHDPAGKYLDVPFHEPTQDNPANRLMADQLNTVRRHVRTLAAILSDWKDRTSDTETDLLPRLPRKLAFLRDIDQKLLRYSRMEPFCHASENRGGVAGLNTVSGHPHYLRAYQSGGRIIRRGINSLSPDEKHYLAPTWAIYEGWCFVVLAQALEAAFPEYSWSLDQPSSTVDHCLTGRNGDASIRLYSQLVCGSMLSRNRYGYCSVSRQRIPDLLLEVDDFSGKRFMCLDSKYSVSRSRILDAMASAHIYRDSIRRGDATPVLSILLVPDCESGISMLTNNSFWGEHGVGCFALCRDPDAELLLDRLRSALSF
ncbi:hypothetical protein T9A_01394 [Alcanivorax jadensis T9]|jgi:hypothetical protein|uniref:DUF2357 domain-containing protein n=1 Tax=Alcanivorax jadensis T9 TaxID=1177181 RepID=A0ABR4WDQ5_9GAMM|nr:nuclease domain-containing protein [Alcanivorax jadensis]KGD61445.1 hypothetical protein T9A_01394 [Alcanivorax jadensis T9]MBP23444.1 hypothetical protein [Alcanivorax sp.]